jgi:alkaline phosphatase
MFTSLIAKILATFMSLAIMFGTLFGTFEKPSTKNPEYYFDNNIKNVIYLIGDGMGFNHLEKTKSERKTTLVMDSFQIKGSSMTRSYSDKITDSAAGGTALSTGIRTANSVVGAYFIDKESKYFYPKNLTELCLERGMMTGVVTTDETSGATPAAFSAHSSDRYNIEDITNDQLASGIDLIWGAANGIVTKADAESNGFEYVDTYAEMMSLKEGSRSFGQFEGNLWMIAPPNKSTPNLEQMAVKAVDLLDDTDEGFFLMIEGAHIDKHSHSNDSEKTTEAVLEFDRTIKAMLEYAKADGETLVIVTADHETGGIVLNDNSYVYTSYNHTDDDVPILVYGTDKLIASNEKINNYEIPIRISYVIGFSKDQFPVSVTNRKK